MTVECSGPEGYRSTCQQDGEPAEQLLIAEKAHDKRLTVRMGSQKVGFYHSPTGLRQRGAAFSGAGNCAFP